MAPLCLSRSVWLTIQTLLRANVRLPATEGTWNRRSARATSFFGVGIQGSEKAARRASAVKPDHAERGRKDKQADR